MKYPESREIVATRKAKMQRRAREYRRYLDTVTESLEKQNPQPVRRQPVRRQPVVRRQPTRAELDAFLGRQGIEIMRAYRVGPR